MKKILLVLLLLATPALAQDSPVAFFGGKYDNGPYTVTGVGIYLGKGLWSFSATDFGDEKNVYTEVAYLYKLPFYPKVAIGPVAGPNAQWEETYDEDDVPTLSRITGLAGGLVTYSLYDEVGLWGFYKYKFAFEGTFKDRSIVAVGVYFAID